MNQVFFSYRAHARILEIFIAMYVKQFYELLTALYNAAMLNEN